MRKLFIIMAAILAVVAFSPAAFAANTVQMTLTSPVIYKAGCEKAGSLTFSFDAGSKIEDLDWWYFDLPNTVTLCKNYNYVIAGKTEDALPNVYIGNTNYDSVGFNAADIGQMSTDSTDDDYCSAGPLQPEEAGSTTGNAITYHVTNSLDGNMAFLVHGTSGNRRITIYALSDGNAGITVNTDFKLNMKLFDGVAHSDQDTVNHDTIILLDTDGDGIYGEDNTGTTTDEVIGGNNTQENTAGTPYVENTLCIDATGLSGDYVYVSFASRSDKFTFTGDSQIAHTGSSSTITLEECKGDSTDDIELTSSQSATNCVFDYDSGTEVNYCTDNFENRFLIQASNTGGFGDIDDKYTVDIEITSPSDGVYFGALAAVQALDSNTSGVDVCDDSGTTLVAGSAANWTLYEGSSTTTTIGDNDCAVGSGYMVDKMVQNSANVTMDLDDYDTLYVNLGDFHFSNTAVAAGEEVTVQVSLNRYPCGTIFEESRTIGTFVTSCSSTSTTTLYYPWFPGSAAAGWWGGFVITNVGTTAGTATLTYSDSEGDSATYTTSSIAAGAQFVDTNVSASDLTDVSGETYDSTLNYSVMASCNFTAKGFAFTGNGNEGTGYLAD